jgi:hypothetical protein
MAIFENLDDRKFAPTDPFDPTDVPRFSQLSETAKDVFAKEITDFFNYKTYDGIEKIKVFPNIKKFALGASNSQNSLETVVNFIMAFGDTKDKFPMISITSQSIKERKMSLGSNFVGSFQYAPSVVGRNSGPFNLSSSVDSLWFLTIKTRPLGTDEEEPLSILSFVPAMFSNLSSVTALEISDKINKSQALYYTLSATNSGKLRISTGGPCANSTPNYVEIVDGTPELLNILGFSIGDSDDYLSTTNLPKNRYDIAGDAVISIDVVSDDLNTRTEVSDLVYNFFTFYMEKRKFEFFGRSYFERETDPPEWFHIILDNKFSWSTEFNRPRPGGEQYEYIYAIRGSVPIFIEDFIDKDIKYGDLLLRDRISYDGSFPNGDYNQDNYKYLYKK